MRPISGSRKHRKKIALAFCGGFLLLVGVALATPGLLATATTHARGTLGVDQNIHSKSGVEVRTKGSVDVVTQQVVIAGGGHTGWHSHPGPVLVTVKSGALRLIYGNDHGCTGTVYQAGQTFIDRGDAVVHIARNVSQVDPVELWATYFVPGDPGVPFRLDAPAASDC